MRLCNSRLPEEHFGYYQTSQRKWVIIKEYYRCLQWSMLGWRISRLGFVTPIVGEVSLGPLGNTHHISLASITTNMLVVRWCITERVKRLAVNEIELGIGYRRSNLGQVTYRWQSEQHLLLCGLTDKDLRRICRSQYGHPGPAIGYWPETSSRSCLHSSRTRRVRTLNVTMTVIMSLCILMYRRLFGVPDVITDMTRSLEMVET